MHVDNHALNSSRANVYLILVVGVLAASTAAPLIRAAIGAGAPLLVVATLRMTIASLLLTAPALMRSRGEYARLNRREVLLAVLSGVILGGHFAFWIGSIALTSVMSAVVLVSTVPLWVALASPLLLKERNSLWTWGGIFVALAGTMLIGFKDVQQGAGLALRGDAFALAGAFFGAVSGLSGVGCGPDYHYWRMYGLFTVAQRWSCWR